MPHRYDAAIRQLTRNFAGDWGSLLPRSAGVVTALDTDQSMVTSTCDALLGFGDPLEEALHLEFQSSRDEFLPARVLRYNTLAFEQHRRPVSSIVMLLRPAAEDASLTGQVEYSGALAECRLQFRYQVIRLWETPAERWLDNRIGLTPLAILAQPPERSPGQTIGSDTAQADQSISSGTAQAVRSPDQPLEQRLSETVRRLAERAMAELPPEKARDLLAAAFVLSGLRMDKSQSKSLFGGLIDIMRDSTTYQAILEEGEQLGLEKGERIGIEKGKRLGVEEGKRLGVEEGKRLGSKEGERIGLEKGEQKARQALRESLFLTGSAKFGAPDAATLERLNRLTDLSQLQALLLRVMTVSSWRELLPPENGAAAAPSAIK